MDYKIAPHVLAHDDGRVLCLPCEEDGRRGLAIFASEDAAEDLAPDGFSPHYVGPRDIERLGRAADVQLVGEAQERDELEGSVFELDSFLAVLTGEIG